MNNKIQSMLNDDGNFESYAWPGGYPLFYLCADNGVLCPDCANQEKDLIMDAIANPGTDAQWEITDCDVNWEYTDLTCDHCNNQIESAYGDDNE